MRVTIENETLKIFPSPTDDISKVRFLGRIIDGNHYEANWPFMVDMLQAYPDVEMEEVDREKLRVIVKAITITMNEAGTIAPWDYDGRFDGYLNAPYKFRDFQARAIRFIAGQRVALLADDVGVGKTLCTIGTFLHLIDMGLAAKFLIVVPASLRMQWLAECRKFINWEKFPDISVTMVRAERQERLGMYRYFNADHGCHVMILSYNCARDDRDEMVKLKVDMVILDEATRIKCRTTKTNQTARDLWSSTPRKLALTATPIENGLEDLYCIVEWLDKRRFKTKDYFFDRYCIMRDKKIWRGRGQFIKIKQIVGYKNIPDARQKLCGLFLRRTVRDVALELPAVIHQTISVEMDEDQRAAYDEVVGKIIGEMTRIDVIGQLVLLQEICNSPITVGRSGLGAKVKEFARMMSEEYRWEKVVAITRFEKFANVIYKELKKSHDIQIITGSVDQKKRHHIIEDFVAGDPQKILVGTSAIEEGLNLQAGAVLVNLDMPWNPAKLQQRLGRIMRMGSEHKIIRMVNLITEDTMEARVIEVLYSKGLLFEQMFRRDEAIKISSMLELSEEQARAIIKG